MLLLPVPPPPPPPRIPLLLPAGTNEASPPPCCPLCSGFMSVSMKVIELLRKRYVQNAQITKRRTTGISMSTGETNGSIKGEKQIIR